MTGRRSTLGSRRLTSRLIGFLSILLFAASGCLASNDPFRSAAFPTPQASLFTSAGLQPRLLDTEDLHGEFTLVAFERMVSQGGNRSDISIDISRSPQPIERYLFVIDRSRHSVTVLNADTQDIPEDLGDIHVRLTLEVTDPVALAGYVSPDTTVFRFAVQYVSGFIRIVDLGSQIDSVVELTKQTEGTQSTLIQTQLIGLRATLKVDVLDLDDDNDEDGLEQDVVPISRQDKPQQPLSLGDSSAGGSVNIEVRLEEEAPPLAVLPPPTDDIQQPDPDEPPESDDQPPVSQPEPPPQNSGQNDEPPPLPTPTPLPPPQVTVTPEPTDPEGEENIPTSTGGDPIPRFVDLVLIIDNSLSMRLVDINGDRLDAARAFLTAARNGDRIGIVLFSDKVEPTQMRDIFHNGKSRESPSIGFLKDRLEVEIAESGGKTLVDLGLKGACEVLKRGNVPKGKGVVVMLSDGSGNLGNDPKNPLVVDMKKCYLDNDWPIYAVGFGNYDKRNLDGVVKDTGGRVSIVEPYEMAKLVCTMQIVRTQIAGGGESTCLSRTISIGEDEFKVQVPDGLAKVTFTVNWIAPGAKMEVRLVRPSGNVVNGKAFLPSVKDTSTIFSYDSSVRSGKTFEAYGIENPEPGTWRVIVKLLEAPEDDLPIVYGYSTIPGP